jgi:hypothetical protein
MTPRWGAVTGVVAVALGPADAVVAGAVPADAVPADAVAAKLIAGVRDVVAAAPEVTGGVAPVEALGVSAGA